LAQEGAGVYAVVRGSKMVCARRQLVSWIIEHFVDEDAHYLRALENSSKCRFGTAILNSACTVRLSYSRVQIGFNFFESLLPDID
jgi:hypothetical protein